MRKVSSPYETGLLGLEEALSGPRLPRLLAVYFGLHLLIRLSVSSTLALDEAEQVLLGQWYQWGYSGQPPLYAWVQHLVFDLLGTNLLALALLKNGLLFLSYLFFWLTARRFWPDRLELASLVVLSWLLIPQIVWEAQRDLSHSVMVLALSSASLYTVARALTPETGETQQRTVWYLAYGTLMGLGMLSKYNFLVFAGALNLALLSMPQGRTLLLNPRIFLAVASAAVVFAPHLNWAIAHAEVAVRSLSKTEVSGDNNRLVGLGILLLAGVSFLTPLWMAYLALFRRAFQRLFRQSSWRGGPAVEGLLRRYLVILALGLATGVSVLGVGHVKERWMIPFLFLVPLIFFARAGKGDPDLKGGLWFRRLAASAAVLTLVASGLRAVLGPTLGATTRVNYPFDAVAERLSDVGSGSAYLLTHNTWFAGNLLKRFPQTRAYVPGYVFPDPAQGRPVLVVWDAVRSEPLPEEVREDLVSRFGLDPNGFEPDYFSLPYKFGAGREARVGYLRLGGSPGPSP